MPDLQLERTALPPLGDEGDQSQLNRLDLELSRLRQREAELGAASGGNVRAQATAFGKAPVQGGSRAASAQARVERAKLGPLIQALEAQRGQLVEAAGSRRLALAETLVRKLPPADQETIHAVQADPEPIKGQIEALLSDALAQRESGNVDLMINTATAALALSDTLDKAMDPTTMLPGASAGTTDASTNAMLGMVKQQGQARRPAYEATLQAVQSIVPQIARGLRAQADASAQAGGGGLAMSATPGAPPEGFSRAPVDSAFGPANELRAPAGQQLAFQSGPGDSIQAGTVPGGLGQGGTAGSGFAGFQANPELTARMNMPAGGPAAAVAPPALDAGGSPSFARMQATGSPLAEPLPPPPPPFVGRGIAQAFPLGGASPAPAPVPAPAPGGAPDPSTAIMQRVQSLLSQGVPPQAIAQELAARGIDPRAFGL